MSLKLYIFGVSLKGTIENIKNIIKSKEIIISEKAVSEVIGMVMILSIMVVVIGLIMIVGVPMIESSRDRAKMDVAANTFLSLQNDIEEVVRGPIWVRDPSNITLINGTGPSRETEFELMGGTLSVYPNSNGITYQIASYTNRTSIERAAHAIRLKMAGIPDDPAYAQQWSLQKIAWDQAYGNISINGSARIAILDTGVDATHPDLADRMIAGKSFVNGDPNTDPNGHGTALAGIAAARVNNSMGMAGVSYANTGIMSVQVLQPNGTGYDKDVVKGVLWAADNGANVILMGFSSPDYSTSLDNAIKYAWRKGIVVIAATGNGGSTAPSYPAGMTNVIGVAATDENDNIISSSNTGSASVAAPGVNIFTTMPGKGYGNVGGTSAASAHVAGLAALLAANKDSNGNIYNQIRSATDPVESMPFGRINVAKALGAMVAPLSTPTVTATPMLGATPKYVMAAASDGTGTMTINPTSTTAGSTGNSFTFTFKSPNGQNGVFNAGSQMAITIPSGWTAPQASDPTNPGFISVTSESCTATLNSINGSIILINMTCSSGSSFTVTYAGGGTKVTVPTAIGPYTFTTQTKQNGGTLTNITNQPIVTVNNPVPTIMDISQTSAIAGDPGFTIIVNGTNFVSTSVIQFNGISITTTFLSSTQLTANILASNLMTAGTFSITVINPTPGGGTSNPQTFTVNPAAASILVVSGFPSPITAGTSGTFTVTAKDTFGNTATGYNGTVNFTSSDNQSVLPFDYLFVAGDNGIHTFSATLNTTGIQSITATDTVITLITGSQTGINVTLASTPTPTPIPIPIPTPAAGNYTINISSGNITYTAGQESIVYENGAVIRKYEAGDALMISDPLINIYNKGDGNIVISIHSISINGTSSSVGGDGKAWVETRLESYNQTTSDLVISNQQTSINILTIYPQAWKAFFDKKLDDANLPTTDYSYSISTTSISVTIRKPTIFSLYESKLDIKVR